MEEHIFPVVKPLTGSSKVGTKHSAFGLRLNIGGGTIPTSLNDTEFSEVFLKTSLEGKGILFDDKP